jgi:hypothetical protein
MTVKYSGKMTIHSRPELGDGTLESLCQELQDNVLTHDGGEVVLDGTKLYIEWWDDFGWGSVDAFDEALREFIDTVSADYVVQTGLFDDEPYEYVLCPAHVEQCDAEIRHRQSKIDALRQEIDALAQKRVAAPAPPGAPEVVLQRYRVTVAREVQDVQHRVVEVEAKDESQAERFALARAWEDPAFWNDVRCEPVESFAPYVTNTEAHA